MNATKPFNMVNSNIINLLQNMIYCILIAVMALSCSSRDDRQESLKKFGTNKFDPNLWAISNEYVRGTMIHDFLMKNAPITNKDRRFIISQLGKSTGYFEYDLNPAYHIGNKPQASNLNAYLIAFIVDHESGMVLDILVYPAIE